MSFGRPDATPTPMISLWRLAQVGCITVAVALVCVVLLLRFWLPWRLDEPQRDAEHRVRETMAAELAAAARAGGLDAHAALRTARASNARLMRFTDGADGTQVDVEQLGYGAFLGGGTASFCFRLTVGHGPEPQVKVTKRDSCPRPSTGHRGTARIREAAEKTRAMLAAANEDGPVTRERARPVVAGALGALWSFYRQDMAERVAVADYISLTATGEVEAAECTEFHIIRRPKTRKVTLHRLHLCPPP